MSAGNTNPGVREITLTPKFRQSGFTLVGALILCAFMGAGALAYGELASHNLEREKEAELLFRGNAYRQAIESYYRHGERYPQTLAELVEDKRHPMPVRHIRKLYPDPITGHEHWGTLEAPGGGIMGVYSKSEAPPRKSGNFRLVNKTFADAKRYMDWQFFYQPGSSAPVPGKS
jgi:type II secretory pathway pseudopilin PulG